MESYVRHTPCKWWNFHFVLILLVKHQTSTKRSSSLSLGAFRSSTVPFFTAALAITPSLNHPPVKRKEVKEHSDGENCQLLDAQLNILGVEKIYIYMYND